MAGGRVRGKWSRARTVSLARRSFSFSRAKSSGTVNGLSAASCFALDEDMVAARPSWWAMPGQCRSQRAPRRSMEHLEARRSVGARARRAPPASLAHICGAPGVVNAGPSALSTTKVSDLALPLSLGAGTLACGALAWCLRARWLAQRLPQRGVLTSVNPLPLATVSAQGSSAAAAAPATAATAAAAGAAAARSPRRRRRRERPNPAYELLATGNSRGEQLWFCEGTGDCAARLPMGADSVCGWQYIGTRRGGWRHKLTGIVSASSVLIARHSRVRVCAPAEWAELAAASSFGERHGAGETETSFLSDESVGALQGEPAVVLTLAAPEELGGGGRGAAEAVSTAALEPGAAPELWHAEAEQEWVAAESGRPSAAPLHTPEAAEREWDFAQGSHAANAFAAELAASPYYHLEQSRVVLPPLGARVVDEVQRFLSEQEQRAKRQGAK